MGETEAEGEVGGVVDCECWGGRWGSRRREMGWRVFKTEMWMWGVGEGWDCVVGRVGDEMDVHQLSSWWWMCKGYMKELGGEDKKDLFKKIARVFELKMSVRCACIMDIVSPSLCCTVSCHTFVVPS